MANLNRPLVPAFLQQTDERLLRNNPAVWQTRFHLVLYYSVLLSVVLALLCLISFSDARQYSSKSGFVTLSILASLLGLVVWVIYLLRFNVFKRFGNWRATDSLLTFLLYFLSTGFIVAICFVPSAVESLRANQQFGDEEIVKDINEINTTACLLEYDLLDRDWRPDTCLLVDRKDLYPNTEIAVADTMAIPTVVVRSYNRIDSSDFSRRMQETDSLVKLRDSLYVFYSVPDYQFVSSYTADRYTKLKMLSSEEIYRQYLKVKPNPDRGVLTARLKQLATKWAIPARYAYGDELTYAETDSYGTKIRKKYNLYRADDGIDNAVEKKYAWREDGLVFLRIFYYVTLALTMLLFIYRHSSTRTFFLSLLTGVLLSLVTGLLMLISSGSESNSFFFYLVFYYIIAGVIGLSVFWSDKRTAVQGIALNIFVYMSPFMPLVITAMYISSQITHNIYYPAKPETLNTELLYNVAELTGVVLTIVLIQFLFSRLYRKWFTAPED